MRWALLIALFLTAPCFAAKRAECEDSLRLSPALMILKSAVQNNWLSLGDLEALSQSEVVYNPLDRKPKTTDSLAAYRALSKWSQKVQDNWSAERVRVGQLMDLLKTERKQQVTSKTETVRMLSVKEVVNRRLENFAQFSTLEQNGAKPGFYFEMEINVYHLTHENGFQVGGSIHTIPDAAWGTVTHRDKIILRGKQAFYLGHHTDQVRNLWTNGSVTPLGRAHTDSVFLDSQDRVWVSGRAGVGVKGIRIRTIPKKGKQSVQEIDLEDTLFKLDVYSGVFFENEGEVFMVFRWSPTVVKIVCVTKPNIAPQTLELQNPSEQPPRILKHGLERYLLTTENQGGRLIVLLHQASHLSQPARRFAVDGRFIDLNGAGIFTNPLTNRTVFAIPDQRLLNIFDFDESEATMRLQIPDLTHLHWLETPDQVYFASMDSEVGTRLRIFSLFNESPR